MLHSRTILAIALIIALILSTSFLGTPGLFAEVPTTFAGFVEWADSYLADAVGKRTPGVVAAFFENGSPTAISAYGYADFVRQNPIGPDSIFQVASISKTVTGYGIMKLVDQKRIELDAPAESYLTRWEIPGAKWDSAEITVERLLSHTAGLSLGGYPGFPPEEGLPAIEKSLSGDTGRFLGLFSPGEVYLRYEPGTRWRYSGGGFTVLQLVIEEITGSAFEDWMKSEILAPLDLHSSTFDPYAVDSKRLAVGHNRRGKPVPNYLFTAKAAAGLYSTAGDLTRVLRDLLSGASGDPALLTNRRYAEMTGPKYRFDDKRAIGMPYFLDVMPDGSTLAYHYGGNIGWRAFYGVNLHRGEGIVILTNSNRGEKKLIAPVLDEYRRYLAR